MEQLWTFSVNVGECDSNKIGKNIRFLSFFFFFFFLKENLIKLRNGGQSEREKEKTTCWPAAAAAAEAAALNKLQTLHSRLDGAESL